MAESRFVEVRSGESWLTLSNLFSEWVQAQGHADSFGWSEGDPLSLPDGTNLICFRIPDKHGVTMERFKVWAETTERLYGIAEKYVVHFPRRPGLVVELPVPPEIPVPAWLRERA